MTTPAKTHPSDCPEPFNHEIFRYCPTCTWTEDFDAQEEYDEGPEQRALLADASASPTVRRDRDHTRITLTMDPRERRMRGVATHGLTPFDVPFVSEVDMGLWQGGCESGLVLPENINNLVSLYPWERYTIRKPIASELYVTMYDSTDQGFGQVESIARWVNSLEGNTLVHCQAGLNRSSLIAARVLMLRGLTANQAIKRIRSRRSPACLCNPSFEAYLLSLD